MGYFVSRYMEFIHFTCIVTEVLAMLNNFEVSRQTVNFIETGRYMPSTVVALKIARYFGKHADEIFQLEDSD